MKQELLQIEHRDFVENNNRILLPNSQNINIFRETIKLWTCLLLKKEYGEHILFITTDHKIPGSEDVADILVYFRDEVVPFEIHGKVTDEMKERIIQRDNSLGLHTYVIPSDQISKEFSAAIVELRKYVSFRF